MQTHTITTYQFAELSPEARARAVQDYRERYADHELLHQSDMLASFKSVYTAAGVKLIHYDLGAYVFNSVDILFPGYYEREQGLTADLVGARAMAWLESHLYSGLRITRAQYLRHRRSYFGYGSDYRVGKIKPAPFTGTCYDYEFLDCIQYHLKNSDSLGQIFKRRLPERYQQLAESAYEYETSDDYITEQLEQGDDQFLQSGRLYTL